jgi:hypothetical protein
MLQYFKKLMFWNGNNTSAGQEEVAELKFERKRSIVLRELRKSKAEESWIGVHAEVLGVGIVISCVEDLYSRGGQTIVVLKPYDILGHPIENRHVSLNEIESVCSFNGRYQHPCYGNHRCLSHN